MREGGILCTAGFSSSPPLLTSDRPSVGSNSNNPMGAKERTYVAMISIDTVIDTKGESKSCSGKREGRTFWALRNKAKKSICWPRVACSEAQANARCRGVGGLASCIGPQHPAKRSAKQPQLRPQPEPQPQPQPQPQPLIFDFT